MKLHEDREAFESLSQVVSQWRGIPVEAVKRDYIIVFLLKRLSESEFGNRCVFKGGTSLSKCYPGTIERFSEDIDLTFLDIELSEKQKDKSLKKIERLLWFDLSYEKIADERSKVSKSSWIWFDDIGDENKIKLEIGSSIRPQPSQNLTLKTYYQEYLEKTGNSDVLVEFGLSAVTIKVLDITRTFLDKVLAVKRHSYNKDLLRKVRHIYDVVKLFEHSEVERFLQDKQELKELLSLTKQTDRFYIGKRKNHLEMYEPDRPFDFNVWREFFDTKEIKRAYETLHEDLLYTDNPQNFSDAIHVFEKIDEILKTVEND